MRIVLAVPVLWRKSANDFVHIGSVPWPYELSESNGWVPHRTAQLRKFPVWWRDLPLSPVDAAAEQTFTYQSVVKRIDVVRGSGYGSGLDCVILDDPHELRGFDGFRANKAYAALASTPATQAVDGSQSNKAGQ